MKIQLYKISLIILLFAPIYLLANDNFKGKHTKEKTIKKEFSVNSDALLKVTNSYGNLNITSWNENRVVIEVHIKVNGNNEEKVNNKLDEINIDFEATNSVVAAKTIFNENKSGWNWGWGSTSNVNMQIDYSIKIPVKNNIQLHNDYGNIILDRIDGHAKISCDYGRLEIGELRGRNNQLSFDYTSKSTIGYINSGKITADYSGFTIEKAGDLDINSDYTNGSIISMKNLTYNNNYGKIEVGTATNIEGNGDYNHIKLGTVHGNVSITSDYGGIQITTMAKDAGDIKIRSDYTGIKIGYHPNYNFNFEISTEYAGVNGKDNFEINVSREDSSEKYYSGYYGSSASKKLINITSDYGSISFTKN
ncbi:DUF4097 domain-containing protein [Cellulophaga baltica]|uniref:DUF4097 domain-containing protein n=1 Tax=Cellulophaga TaxID=104264 RepID=UPI001C07441C|nr:MULTISPECIES: DUF4097 domain-containing protein [Cellulophaga]MBU2994879.1 DUF4097 domain-containing protein [Cellulophaga baltica]MDO6766273.1 DUF4097 domain-containing protein [Cellulophaga sp. 1_MG-2023]